MFYDENQNIRCVIECKIHGIGKYWGNPWNPLYKNIKNKKSGCPKCSRNYKPSNKEAIVDLKKNLSKEFCFISFVGGSYNGSRTKCNLKCKVHGLLSEWEKPSYPIYESLKTGTGCYKCSLGNKHRSIQENNRKSIYKEKDIIDNIKKRISEHDNISFYSFMDNNFKNLETKCIVECKKCGRSDKWERPILKKYQNIMKNGFKCPKCNKNKNYGIKKNNDNLKLKYEEAIKNIIKYTKNNNIIFHGFIDGYKNSKTTKCSVSCEVHGKGENWENPWIPTYDNLKRGTKCPKCTGNYKESWKEIYSIIKEKSNELGYQFHGLEKEYSSLKNIAKVSCNIHGQGVCFEKKWKPTLSNLKYGSSCPICSKIERRIEELKNYPELYVNDKYLYFIKIKHKDNIFYKIGLFKESIDKRYRKKNLIKDDIKIIYKKIIKLPNIIAVMSEYWVLKNYKDYSINKQEILKSCYGGTECFSYDILQGGDIDIVVNETINNKNLIFEKLKFTKEQKIKCIEIINYFNNSKINKDITKKQP